MNAFKKITYLSFAAWLFLGHACLMASQDQPPTSVQLEALTWMEVDRLMRENDFHRVLVPTGGTEQNGPHMTLGKHNAIVRHCAERIAIALGKTLVAPVLAYVPEGDWSRREGHMKFPGTISLSRKNFENALEDIARSLESHGFKEILFIGDSFDNQAPQEAVAKKLSQTFKKRGVKVASIRAYYDLRLNGELNYLHAQGFDARQIGTHAGIRDTSEMMFVDQTGIRPHKMESAEAGSLVATGSDGKPSLASRFLGEKLVELKIRSAIQAIKDKNF